jgi:manganese/iron transport system substrate-binding protein
VTTFTVIADMEQNVGGDAAEAVSITKPGAEIHGYQPTPGDLVRAQGADLILWNGQKLKVWFEQFFANLGDAPDAVISDGVVPISISGGEYDGKPNPHGWTALAPVLIYVDNIREAMSAADPDNAAVDAANAESYKAQIAATIGPLRDAALTLPEDRHWLVRPEGAFSYLARAFGLNEASPRAC